MNMLDWDIRDARAAAAKEGRAEGCAEGTGNEQDRGASLITAMERDGLGPQEILEVLKDPAKREELHGKNGIAA